MIGKLGIPAGKIQFLHLPPQLHLKVSEIKVEIKKTNRLADIDPRKTIEIDIKEGILICLSVYLVVVNRIGNPDLNLFKNGKNRDRL